MRIPLLSNQPQKATDPVCHMEVDMKRPPGGTWEFSGVSYYFCGPGCNRAFQKEPEPYLSGEKDLHMDH